MRQIIIDLYDHTSDDEVADILACLVSIGLDDARVENDDA